MRIAPIQHDHATPAHDGRAWVEGPHAGALYYEKRQFFTWQRMSAAIAAWRATRPRP